MAFLSLLLSRLTVLYLQATEVQSFVQNNPHLGFALILQLTGVNGSQQFDKLTKTKTVESILASMNVEGIDEYTRYLLVQSSVADGEDRYYIVAFSAFGIPDHL